MALYQNKIGLSDSYFESRDSVERMFAYCKDAGIETLEICRGKLEAANQIDFDAYKRESEKTGIKFNSYHIPFSPFSMIDPSAIDEEKRQYALTTFKGLMKKAAAIGINLFVIHPSGEPIDPAERPARMEQTKKTFKELAEFADTLGARVAVEDLPRTCLGHNSAEILEILSVDPRLVVCFDTNHLTAEDNMTFIKNVGPHIVTTHISDYDFINERHVMPGEGKINWPELLDALMKTGYKGPLLYETDEGSTIRITRKAPLTPAQFKKNADDLKEGIQPDPIDTDTHFN